MTETPEDRFVDLMGFIAQAENFPRISGQIMGFLVLAGEARSLTEIAEGLGVSKASVSTNVRLLEARGSVARETRRGSRQDLWRVVAQPQRNALLNVAERFGRNALRLDEVADSFAAAQDPEKQQKVADFADFYRRSSDYLRTWADHLTTSGAEQAADPTGKDRHG